MLRGPVRSLHPGASASCRVEGGEEPPGGERVSSFAGLIVQILLLDVVFALDSVITAVGMANEVIVMMVAIIIAVGVMMIAVGPISRFIEQHHTVEMLALNFLLLIGMTLVANGLGPHIPKDYIYFAMGFSILVEFLNRRAPAFRGQSARGGAMTWGHLPRQYRSFDGCGFAGAMLH